MNPAMKKNLMPTLPAHIRKHNFAEVTLGYTKKQAVDEANRCLHCKHKPCMQGCPVHVHIPEFIEKVAKEKFEEAYQIIQQTNSLPAVCGRVCPQENQCEKNCVRNLKGEAVGIGRLERFVADFHNRQNIESKSNIQKKMQKVAIIGSGPAGLACAGDLAKLGYQVTIFEALHLAGGVLMYGIPEFRLPKEIVKKELDNLISLGVEIKTNMVIGKVLSLEELKQDYDAIFIGSGAGLPKFMNIPGENFNGVYSANEFLTRVNLMKGYQKNAHTPLLKANNVAIVGGGNVAMDAARCAKRLGAENVAIIYRRSFAEIPARKEEVEHAIEEGIEFKILTNPIEIFGDEKYFVKSIKCVEMELGEPDASGRRKPIVKQNSEFEMAVDCVIMAIGTSPNPLLSSTTKELKTQPWGGIIIDENGKTSIEGVYAGGDSVTGAATVILAMGAGKKAAQSIDIYLNNKKETSGN